MEDQTSTPAERDAKKTFVTIPLDEPIKREGSDVTEVKVRRPLPETMDGLSLRDIVDMDARTMRQLLPRITEPTLTPVEIATMDPFDFFCLSGAASDFLLPRGLLQAFL